VTNANTAPTTLTFRAGRVQAHHWPAHVTPPFGLHNTGQHLEGPARLRWRLRQSLEHANALYRDAVAPRPSDSSPLIFTAKSTNADTTTSANPLPANLRQSIRQANYRGILIGYDDHTRLQLVTSIVRAIGQPALIITTDTAAEHRWQLAATRAGLHESCRIRGIRSAASNMHWLGGRHEVLIVDTPELMPASLLDQTLEASAALARIGLTSRRDSRNLMAWGKGIGPVLSMKDRAALPPCEEIRVPMPDLVAEQYGEAWGTFLAAFDRFAAIRGDAGFGTFIAQARQDTQQRPAVHAWHRALQSACWHEHKSLIVADLLEKHRGERVVVFTPDRRCAYELANEHLIAAITSELSRRERDSLLSSFGDGSLRTIAGPKLLDAGIEERSADVGILVGGGYGMEQRAVRCRRVREDGVIYELVSQNTLEVGRAHRWRNAGPHAHPVVH
jgi:hypothetical protein